MRARLAPSALLQKSGSGPQIPNRNRSRLGIGATRSKQASHEFLIETKTTFPDFRPSPSRGSRPRRIDATFHTRTARRLGRLMTERIVFSDLRELFAKATEQKSGDQLAATAARSEQERVAAKRQLAGLTLDDIVRQPLIDPEGDDVTRLILDTFDQQRFQQINSLTVGEFREFILDDATSETSLKQLQWAIIPEIVAAVAKIMSNKDLVLAAAKIRNVTRCRNTMGERGVLGIRIQPNHPTDDIGGILLAAFEGLLYGCGDAVIGVNPASDSVETTATILQALARLIDAYGVPTQSCCLAHITTQLEAMKHGAPVDLLFQSVAGTEAANRSFGVTLQMLREGREQVLEHHRQRDVRWAGDHVMYFETGQGSALSAEAHHGVDQVTLEARGLRSCAC